MTPRERATRIQYDCAVATGLRLSFETFIAMTSDPAIGKEVEDHRRIIERHIAEDRAASTAQAAAAAHTGGRVQS